MRISIRTLILVFLVAVAGSGLGTYGAITLAEKNSQISEKHPVQVQTVQYENRVKGSYTEAINKAYDSVVEITSQVETTSFFYGKTTGTSKGSGVIISDDGYIVTNAHVVNGASAVSVLTSDSEVYDAELIGIDQRSDLALLKVKASNLNPIMVADSSELELGQEAVVIGNPLGQGISCSNGIISALDKEVTISNYTMYLIQTNAAVNAGNSGGGLFNMNGDLIGIVNAKSGGSAFDSTSVEGMGYAIPSNQVLKIISDLQDYGYVKNRATLGVSVYTSTNSFITSNVSGLVVSGVSEGQGAQKAGIVPGDVIFEIDGVKIEQYSDLTKYLDKCNVGDVVSVGVYRGNETLHFDVTLTEASAQ